jgi:hypothetical protein
VARRVLKWAWRFAVVALAAVAIEASVILFASGRAPLTGAETITPPARPSATPSYAAPAVLTKPDPGVTGAPRRLRVSAIGVDAEVLPYTPEDAQAGVDPFGSSCYQGDTIVCIDPPRMDTVYQQIGGVAGVKYGNDPGLETPTNVYLFGHAGSASGAAVFDDLKQLEPGDTAEVDTDFGTIVYVVDEVLIIAKDEYPNSERIWTQVPGRLVLVSCDQSGPAYASGYSMNTVVAILHAESAHDLPA